MMDHFPASSTTQTADAALVIQHLKDRAEEIAVALLGAPSTFSGSELRWGRHGSLALCRTGRQRGLFMDHERGEGGDVVDLIRRELGVNFVTALEYGAQILGGVREPIRTARKEVSYRTDGNSGKRQAIASRLWSEAKLFAGTPGESYFMQRGLAIRALPLAHAVRWHERQRAVIALMTDPLTGDPTGVHRTFLGPDGRKVDRKMLGRLGVIRLSPDHEVEVSLGIAEGVEDGVAVLLSGWAPIWVATSAGAIARFPVLPGVETLTIFADADDAGITAAETCRSRWLAEGRQVAIASPKGITQ